MLDACSGIITYINEVYWDERERPNQASSPILKSTVVSEKGAAIRVERIEVSERMKQNLTTSAKSIGSPRPGRTK